MTGTDSTERMIRHATDVDLAQITAIYNHYIEQTAFTFDTQPFSTDERRPWFSQFAETGRHQLLVMTEGTGIKGYASSVRLRPKPAYDQSVETSIYLRPDATGQGIGTRLYGELFRRLSIAGVHRCYGIVTQPNEPSMALHRQFGFVPVARLGEVGFKFDRYWDTVWMERPMSGS